MRIMPDSAKSSLVHLRKSSHSLKKQIWCFLVSFCNGCIVQSPLPICGVRVLSDGFRVKQLATTCLEYSTLSYSFNHSKLVLNSSFLLIPKALRSKIVQSTDGDCEAYGCCFMFSVCNCAKASDNKIGVALVIVR